MKKKEGMWRREGRIKDWRKEGSREGKREGRRKEEGRKE